MSDDLRARLLKAAETFDDPNDVCDDGACGDSTCYAHRQMRDLLREAASALAIRGQEHEETDDQARRDKPQGSARQPAASKD